MVRFFKYGRWWYPKRKEAEDHRIGNERILYDGGMKAYYIKRPRQSFWRI